LILLELGAFLRMVLEVLKGIVGLPTTALFTLVTDVGLVSEGAIAGVKAVVDNAVAWLAYFQDLTRGIPTLLSRDGIPNQGYELPQQGWQGTFLGLEPKWAWAIRLLLVVAYWFFLLFWVWRGYETFRAHYRQAEWTPRDDIVDRFRGHRWGQFGLLVVSLFLMMAMFAPTLGTTTVVQNIEEPCTHQIEYYNEEAGAVESITVCAANIESASNGAGASNVGPFSYDRYGRFHPFGTLPTPGKDLFTFMMAGARVSLFVGLVSIGLGGVFAVTGALVSAYYKGVVDLALVVTSDSILSIPGLLLLILASAVFRGHWLMEILGGGLLVALLLGFTNWPVLWRALRGPAFQVSEQEWIDAARSYGQRPRATMKRHMLPYITGYLLIYGSMTLGGVIIALSALSFLGLGIQPPIPEWGRAISLGQAYVATQSWHISLIPGLLIVVVVTGFNALGDGVRDALDPQSDVGGGAEMTAGGGGG
jgi:peptide/nickel transport system permease protein